MFPFTDSPHSFNRSLLGHPQVSRPLLPSIPYPSPEFHFDSPNGSTLAAHLAGLPMVAPPPQFGLPPYPPPPPPPSHPKEASSHMSTASTMAAPKVICGINQNTAVGGSARTHGNGGRKRSPRKDRHSKIFTAQGPRDRRMRLSVDVARRFFYLQDMLGFDKASKTVEWLMAKSESVISQLTVGASFPVEHGEGDPSGESSTSECEVISMGTNDDKAVTGETSTAAQLVCTPARAKGAAIRPPSRKAAAHRALARETRRMARARARERTREKKMWRCSRVHDGACRTLDPALLTTTSPFETAGAKLGIHTGSMSSPEMATWVKQARCYPPEQYRTTVQENSGHISIFDYAPIVAHDGSAINFPQEHWKMQASGNFEDKRVLLADVHLQARPSEPFNNPCI